MNRFTLDSPVEDEGSNLSIGQRSLVSLARALVKDSRILILDEATSAIGEHAGIAVGKVVFMGLYNRLRDGLDHPEVAPDRAREGRDTPDRRAPSTDHHGLGQDRTYPPILG